MLKKQKNWVKQNKNKILEEKLYYFVYFSKNNLFFLFFYKIFWYNPDFDSFEKAKTP